MSFGSVDNLEIQDLIFRDLDINKNILILMFSKLSSGNSEINYLHILKIIISVC